MVYACFMHTKQIEIDPFMPQFSLNRLLSVSVRGVQFGASCVLGRVRSHRRFWVLGVGALAACGGDLDARDSMPNAEDASDVPNASAEVPSDEETSLPGIVVVGGIDNKTVARVVQERVADTDACGLQRGSDRSNRGGTVSVKFSITKVGAVTGASVRHSTLQAPGVEACLLRVIGDLRFPPLDGGQIALVQVPFEVPSSDVP